MTDKDQGAKGPPTPAAQPPKVNTAGQQVPARTDKSGAPAATGPADQPPTVRPEAERGTAPLARQVNTEPVSTASGGRIAAESTAKIGDESSKHFGEAGEGAEEIQDTVLKPGKAIGDQLKPAVVLDKRAHKNGRRRISDEQIDQMSPSELRAVAQDRDYKDIEGGRMAVRARFKAAQAEDKSLEEQQDPTGAEESQEQDRGVAPGVERNRNLTTEASSRKDAERSKDANKD